MARQDHREFHDLCKSLLCFEPSSRLTAAKAVEHEFFHLDITPEYSEESLLLYPDAPIPPPTMPPPVNAAASKVVDAGSGMPSLSGVSSGLAGVVGLDEFPRGTASDAVGPAGPSTFYQGLAPNTAVAQQVSYGVYSLHVACVLSPIRKFRKCLCVGACLRRFCARVCVRLFASVCVGKCVLASVCWQVCLFSRPCGRVSRPHCGVAVYRYDINIAVWGPESCLTRLCHLSDSLLTRLCHSLLTRF